jgi:hypothetical protein
MRAAGSAQAQPQPHPLLQGQAGQGGWLQPQQLVYTTLGAGMQPHGGAQRGVLPQQAGTQPALHMHPVSGHQQQMYQHGYADLQGSRQS